MNINYNPVDTDFYKTEESRYSDQGQADEDKLRTIYFFRLEDGENALRILPPWRGEKDAWDAGRFALLEHKHKFLPPDKKQYVCVKRTFEDQGLRCPICEKMDLLKNQGVDIGKPQIWPQAHVNAIIRSDTVTVWGDGKSHTLENNPPVNVVISLPLSVYIFVRGIFSSPTYGGARILSPTDGTDLVINRNMAAKDNKQKYQCFYSPAGPSPLHPDIEIVENLIDSQDKNKGLYDLGAIYGPPSEGKMKVLEEAANAYFNALRPESTQVATGSADPAHYKDNADHQTSEAAQSDPTTPPEPPGAPSPPTPPKPEPEPEPEPIITKEQCSRLMAVMRKQDLLDQTQIDQYAAYIQKFDADSEETLKGHKDWFDDCFAYVQAYAKNPPASNKEDLDSWLAPEQNNGKAPSVPAKEESPYEGEDLPFDLPSDRPKPAEEKTKSLEDVMQREKPKCFSNFVPKFLRCALCYVNEECERESSEKISKGQPYVQHWGDKAVNLPEGVKVEGILNIEDE